MRGLALVARRAFALGKAGSGHCRQFNDSNGVRPFSNELAIIGGIACALGWRMLFSPELLQNVCPYALLEGAAPEEKYPASQGIDTDVTQWQVQDLRAEKFLMGITILLSLTAQQLVPVHAFCFYRRVVKHQR